jgi:hypothetical protein
VKRIVLVLALAVGGFAAMQSPSEAALLGAAAPTRGAAPVGVENTRYYYRPDHPRRPLSNFGIGPNARPYDYRPIFVFRCHRNWGCKDAFH